MAIYFNNHNEDLFVEAVRLKKSIDSPTDDAETVFSWVYWQKTFAYYYPKLRMHLLSLGWVVLGTVGSCVGIGWGVVDGLHFCVSCMSTSGIKTIPLDSSDTMYFLVAVYSCLGVPILALSSGLLVHHIVSFGKRQDLEQTITAPVTEREVVSLASYGIVDGEGFIDVGEYVILILLRLGVLKPDLIRLIDIRYMEMRTQVAAAATPAATLTAAAGDSERRRAGGEGGRRLSIQDIQSFSRKMSIHDINQFNKSH